MVDKLLAGVVLDDDPKPVKAAACEIVEECVLDLTLTEGKYHQVKRMLAAVSNRVEGLHRWKIGSLALPEDMKPGEWRWLSAQDLEKLSRLKARRRSPQVAFFQRKSQVWFPSLVFFVIEERAAGCYAAGGAPLWRDCCKSNSTPWRKAPWAMRICCSWKVSNTAHITLTPPAMTGRNSSRKPCSGSRSMWPARMSCCCNWKGGARDFASGVTGWVQGLAVAPAVPEEPQYPFPSRSCLRIRHMCL